MTRETDLKCGTVLRVTVGALGALVGRIEDLQDPAALPRLPHAGGAEREVGAILRDWQISRVAMISFRDGAGEWMFAAFEIQGRWFDLNRNELRLEIIGQPMYAGQGKPERN